MHTPLSAWRFQFLGIPPKGERAHVVVGKLLSVKLSFQFLGIPPKGEQLVKPYGAVADLLDVSNF